MRPTQPLFNRPDHLLYRSIDADKVRGRTLYVVVDPADPRGIIYCTESQYLRLSNNALSHDVILTVLLRPGEPLVAPHPRADEGESKNNSGSSRSTTPGSVDVKVSTTRTPGVIGAINSGFLRFRSFVASTTIADGEFLLALTDRNVRVLLFRWAKVLLLRTLGSYHSQVNLSELKSVIGHFVRIYRSQGVNAMNLRMKASLYAMNCYLAGNPVKDTRVQKHAVGLTHGLPSFLPVNVRRAIRQRNLSTIRLYTSLFGSYKGIQGEYGDPDYSSITSKPHDFSHETLCEISAFVPYFWAWATGLNPKDVPLYTRKLHRSSKAGPNDPSAIAGAVWDALCWRGRSVNYFLEWCQLTGSTVLVESYRLVEKSLDEMLEASRLEPAGLYRRLRRIERPSLQLGKLALKEEAAGKIRVFAIVDYWTQCALSPLHDKLFAYLRVLPGDATFNQEGAVKSFVEEHRFLGVYSYDLTSATDTIPVVLSEIVLQGLIGDRLARLWRLLMTDREFALPGKGRGTIRYTRGQPMGALSSWAILAITHHFIVQMAAKRIGQFPTAAYRVLGDDITIAGASLAAAYCTVAAETGLVLNSKGIVSPVTGGGAMTNFANQIILATDNISPVSLREELSITSLTARVESVRRLLDRGFTLGKSKIFSTLSRLANIRISRFRSDISHFSRGLLPRALFGLLLVLSYPSPTKVLEGDQTSPWYTVLALVKGGSAVYGTPEAFCQKGSVPELKRFGYSDRMLTQLLSSAYATTLIQVETTLKALHLSIEGFNPWVKVWNAQYFTILRALRAARDGKDPFGESLLESLIRPIEKVTKTGPMSYSIDLRENRSNRFPIFSWQMVLLHAGIRIVETRRSWQDWVQLHEDLKAEERELAHMEIGVPHFGRMINRLNQLARDLPNPWVYETHGAVLAHSREEAELLRHTLYSWGQTKLPLSNSSKLEPRLSTMWEDKAPTAFNEGLYYTYDLSGYQLGRFVAFPLQRAFSPAEFERKSAVLAHSVSMPFRLLEAQLQDIGVRIEERFHHSDLTKIDGEWFERTTFPWAGK